MKRTRFWLVTALVAASAMLLTPTLGAVTVAPEAPGEEALRGLVHSRGAECNSTDPVPAQLERARIVEFTEDPTAGSWATWVVDVADVQPPAPPATVSIETAQELAELQQIALTRTDQDILEAQSFSDGTPTAYFTDFYLQAIVRHAAKDGAKNPPRLARQMAIMETAMFDGLAAAWAAKYCYKRVPPAVLDPALQPVLDVPPLPTYPSEHAVAAGVAFEVFKVFFPCPDPTNNRTCEEDPAKLESEVIVPYMESRLVAGLNYRSDIEAGFALGREVALRHLADRAEDGSHLTWDGSGRITGPCNWVDVRPPAAAAYGPVEPIWGGVRPFLMASGDQFRAPPPPECDGPDYLAQYHEIYEATKILTQRQFDIAYRWAGGQGTVTPPGQWLNLGLNYTIEAGMSTMRAARVMAHLGAALADSGIAAWDTKFTYWSDRPVTAIRRLWEPGWTSPTWVEDPETHQFIFTTPPFPGYVSGHSTFGGSMKEALDYFFPDKEWELSAYSTEAAMSRFYGGIHHRADNELGILMGNQVGELAALRASQDGADA